MNTAEVYKRIKDCIQIYLPEILEGSLSRTSILGKRDSPKRLDHTIFNSCTKCYERFFVEISKVGEEFFLGIQIAVSIFPRPHIPAGPYGWYANLRDIDSSSGNPIESIWWGNGWYKIGSNSVEAKERTDVIFGMLETRLLSIWNEKGHEVASKRESRALLIELDQLREKLGPSMKPFDSAHLASLEKKSSAPDWVRVEMS